MKKIAIIGFGGAGYSAAKEARQRDAEAEIHVYSDTDLGPYNPMLTTYYVKGTIPYDALFPFGSLEEVQKELNLIVHPHTPVTGLDPAAKTVRLSDGSEARYDAILISTGASAVKPQLEGIELPGVFTMRTVEDAVQLKEALASGKVRAGLVFGASWSGIKGVHLAFGRTLDHIEPSEDGRLVAVANTGERYTADLIAVTSGVRPNLAFLKGTDIAVGKGVTVNEHMESNYPGIYAAGDCCDAFETQSRTVKNLALWLNSMQQGRVAGNCMTGGDARFGANVSLSLAHYLHYDFFSIGDVSICKDADELYEYEDEHLYIRGVRVADAIKCLNVIGSAESNGILKSAFIKAIENKDAGLDLKSVCYLKWKGFPDSFIEFLGGLNLD